MQLDRDQKTRMSLGGTLALPVPEHTIGRVSLSDTDGSLIHVTHAKTPSEAVVWTVRIRDVAALEQTTAKKRKKKKSKWYVGRRKILKALRKKPRKGVLYVREGAATLLNLEFGVSALQSADVALQSGLVPADRLTDEAFGIACSRPECD